MISLCAQGMRGGSGRLTPSGQSDSSQNQMPQLPTQGEIRGAWA